MKPADVEAVIALFEEELRFHIQRGLFARVTVDIVESFRAKLIKSLCGAGAGFHEETPVVLVAESSAGIIAMVQTSLLPIRVEDEPGFTPPGYYGCIEHLCVSARARGQGIGRALSVLVMMMLQREQQDGYLLWYSVGNSLSARFWPRMGFVPLWTTYQRHTAMHT